jgi:hypothetical protein
MFQQQFWAEGTLFSDSSSNELLIINLATDFYDKNKTILS